MAKPRLKTAAAAYASQSRDDVARDIRSIGDLSRELTRQEASMNDGIAEITERHSAALTDLKVRIQRLQSGVQAWCEAHRDEITEGRRVKSAGFITGEVQWRQRPPSVALRGLDAIIETLKRLGLGRFVRIKEEVNKDAILNEPAAVAGVAGISVVSGIEDFIVVPFEQEAS